MKRTTLIVSLAAAFFVLILSVAWQIGTNVALRNTQRVLAQSETLFAEAIDDYVYSILLHTSRNVHRLLGESVRVLPTEQMAEMARRFGVDELNVADRRGRCVASNQTGPGGVGYDFASYAETVPYLALTDGVTKVVSQPFRNGTTNPEDYTKYLGFAFADGSGFTELGFRFERLAPVFDFNSAETVRKWTVGRTGHLAYFSDYRLFEIPGDTPDGVMAVGRENGERVFCRPFFFAGHRYLSVLPEREYFQARNSNFMIFAPALMAVLAFLILFLRTIDRANETERRRRAAEDEGRARDLAFAREIQLSGQAPATQYRREVFTMTFDAVSHPAREVGGDFYDFFFIDSVHLAFVIADVAGKGIPAALYMMRARNEFFNAMLAHPDLVEAIAEANRRLAENNETEMFVTLWAGVIDRFHGTVEYVNAGHELPFVRHADGTVERLPACAGKLLGLFPEVKFTSAAFALRPGDALFLYTDGITEAMDRRKKLYGRARLERTLADCAPDAEAMLAAVLNDVKRFADGAEQSDDITALALVWHGTSETDEREFAAAAAGDGTAMAWLRERVKLANRSAKARLLNAADEVMTNIAAYSGAATFRAKVENAPKRARIVFSDAGRPYNPLTHADPDVRVPLAARPDGGLGILMTKKLVDSVVYRREGDENVLFLQKSE